MFSRKIVVWFRNLKSTADFLCAFKEILTRHFGCRKYWQKFGKDFLIHNFTSKCRRNRINWRVLWHNSVRIYDPKSQLLCSWFLKSFRLSHRGENLRKWNLWVFTFKCTFRNLIIVRCAGYYFRVKYWFRFLRLSSLFNQKDFQDEIIAFAISSQKDEPLSVLWDFFSSTTFEGIFTHGWRTCETVLKHNLHFLICMRSDWSF